MCRSQIDHTSNCYWPKHVWTCAERAATEHVRDGFPQSFLNLKWRQRSKTPAMRMPTLLPVRCAIRNPVPGRRRCEGLHLPAVRRRAIPLPYRPDQPLRFRQQCDTPSVTITLIGWRRSLRVTRDQRAFHHCHSRLSRPRIGCPPGHTSP